MIEGTQRQCVGTIDHTPDGWSGRLWPWYIALGMLLMSSGLLPGGARAAAAERARPFLIGVLTPSWGPTPMTVGLRDGLLALGYREYEQFDIGIRFTQGDVTALPAAAQDLVQYGVVLIIAEGTVCNADSAIRKQGDTDHVLAHNQAGKFCLANSVRAPWPRAPAAGRN